MPIYIPWDNICDEGRINEKENQRCAVRKSDAVYIFQFEVVICLFPRVLSVYNCAVGADGAIGTSSLSVPIHISWENVRYEVPVKAKSKKTSQAGESAGGSTYGYGGSSDAERRCVFGSFCGAA